jgi:hypothetical protein
VERGTARQRSTSSPRITLRQLSRLTRLTPGQSLAIGADLVGELRDLHATRRALGGFGAEHVTLRADGSVGLGADEPRRTTDRAARQADLASARALLLELAATARPRPGGDGPDTAAAALAAHALTSAAARPDGDLLAAATELRAAADAVGTAVRAELAGMAAAVGSPAPDSPGAGSPAPGSPGTGSPAPGSPGTGSPAPGSPGTGSPGASAVLAPRAGGTASSPAGAGGDPRPSRGRAAGSPARPTARRWDVLARYGRWVLALAALAAVLAVELVLLGNRVRVDLDTLSAAGRQQAGGPTRVAPSPPRVAPGAAGPVAGVDLRPLALCVPGSGCEVRVLVRLVPGPDAQRVNWDYLVTDRCTGLVQNAAGGSVTVAGGGHELVVVGQLTLPPARALSVTAVTGTPARAASPPLLVPARASC